MKATRGEPPKPFTPVVLTLESQGEVDALWGIGNHATISMDLGNLEKVLRPFTENGYIYFESLEARLNARGYRSTRP